MFEVAAVHAPAAVVFGSITATGLTAEPIGPASIALMAVENSEKMEFAASLKMVTMPALRGSESRMRTSTFAHFVMFRSVALRDPVVLPP